VEVEPACQTKVDVGFILDSSGSLKNDYDTEKNFLKALAASFGVSDDGARAGVVTFSYNSEHSIKLNDHTSFTTFNDAVDGIPLMGSTTRIDKALRLSQKELFSIANGARPGVRKILILLTDGSQTADADAEDPSVIANEIRKRGIKLLVIGIGGGVNQAELLKLGGNKAENVFSAASFDDLITDSFIESVTQTSCDAGMFLSDQLFDRDTFLHHGLLVTFYTLQPVDVFHEFLLSLAGLFCCSRETFI